MLNHFGKFKRILFFLALSLLFAQLACSGSCGGGSEPSSSPNSNTVANKGNAPANARSGNSASNKASNHNGNFSNNPVGINEGNYPVYPQTGNGGVQNPNFGNNPYPLNNRPPNIPGIQSQNQYPDYQSPGGISGGGSSSSSNSETEYKPATPVMLDLEAAIDRWSDAEAAGYGLKMNLIALWRRRNPTIKYDPVGIDTLTSRIRERPAFINCRRARQLSRNMFHDDGIKTVGQLYDYLEPCGTGGYANFK